jgi:hypothetical protein
MDVYALANDGSVWHKRWSNGWQPWQSTEVTISPAARRLDDAIRHRLTADTLGPLRATGPFGSFALSLVGTAGAFLGLLQQPRDSTFHRAATDEMAMLATLLRAGEPVSVGLLADGLGHEVVAYAGEVNAGGQSRLHVYDPGYPGCDQATITIDPIHRRIMSSTGETWQALWVRHDVPTNTPPV